MKHQKSPNLVVIFAALLVLALPLSGWAQFTYTTNNGAITITGYTGFFSDGQVTIPSTINGYPVTAIGTNAFYFFVSVTDVAIPDTVTNIGDGAFLDCISLTNVTIPGSVTSIGDQAFTYCALTSIAVNAANPNYASAGGVLFNNTLTTLIQYPQGLAGAYPIPSSVTNIADNAFAGSGLTSVTIPVSVTSIGDSAFEYSSVTSVTIPLSVTTIGAEAFAYCGSLTNLDVNASNPSYGSAGGVLFNKTLTTLIQYPGGLAGSYAIPNSVTSIGAEAFIESSSLTSVTIPLSVTNISDQAFAYCGSLTNLDANASNPSYASVGGVLFNKTLTTLIQYPAGLAGSYAIPRGVTKIGDNAFASSRLTKVTIPVSVASIGDAAFLGCRGLTSVTIPNGVTSIGEGAFAFCSGLTSVTIPNSVASLGSYAFQYCTSLNQAFFQGNAPSVNGGAGSADSTVFANSGTGKAYYVPGNTGWGATFGGWPTAQWYQPQPLILGSGNGLGAGSQGFQFTISWATNKSVVVEACTDLQDWMPVSTNTLVNGTSAFVDSTWTNYPRRFYRLSSQ